MYGAALFFSLVQHILTETGHLNGIQAATIANYWGAFKYYMSTLGVDWPKLLVMQKLRIEMPNQTKATF